MQAWYLAHQEQLQYWLDWALYTDAFRKLSALILAVGLFALGAEYHAAIGVTMVLMGSIFGFIWGSKARQQRRDEARVAAAA